jgi:hypothetical protein
MPQVRERTRMIHARVAPGSRHRPSEYFRRSESRRPRRLPFPVTIPDAETVAAMAETNNPAGLNRYKSFRELRAKL